jgi:iron-sulfur cluster repair protein YtfE (RIC family)
MYTASLRQQHQDLLKIVGQIAPLLKPEAIDPTQGDTLRKLLVDLTGKLNLHLAAEDKVLYPKMASSNKTDVATAGKQFSTEMGSIGAAYKAYLTKYPNGPAITKSAKEFCTDTSAIFQALGTRIKREESQLYPLADSMAS